MRIDYSESSRRDAVDFVRTRKLAMKYARLMMSATLLTGSVVLVSCSDSSPVAPPEGFLATQAALLAPPPVPRPPRPRSTVGLLTCAPLHGVTITRTIGAGGGTIHIGPHTLVIPAGALASPVAIKATIKAENVARIHLEPSGLRFAQPATLTMSYSHCATRQGTQPTYQIVYVSPDLQSIVESLLSTDNQVNQSVSASIVQLYDYAVDQLAFSDHNVWW